MSFCFGLNFIKVQNNNFLLTFSRYASESLHCETSFLLQNSSSTKNPIASSSFPLRIQQLCLLKDAGSSVSDRVREMSGGKGSVGNFVVPYSPHRMLLDNPQYTNPSTDTLYHSDHYPLAFIFIDRP